MTVHDAFWFCLAEMEFSRNDNPDGEQHFSVPEKIFTHTKNSATTFTLWLADYLITQDTNPMVVSQFYVWICHHQVALKCFPPRTWKMIKQEAFIVQLTPCHHCRYLLMQQVSNVEYRIRPTYFTLCNSKFEKNPWNQTDRNYVNLILTSLKIDFSQFSNFQNLRVAAVLTGIYLPSSTF